jgi:hypothetical protein
MVDTSSAVGVSGLPLAPKSPLPYWQILKAVRSFHTGMVELRDAGGPVTRFSIAPKWLMPELVVAAPFTMVAGGPIRALVRRR